MKTKISTHLSSKQEEVYNLLNYNKNNGLLRRHFSPSGKPCYRLVDKAINPIANVSMEIVKELQDLGVLEVNGQEYTIKDDV